VLARGTVPADIVFIGEAPGPSEDSLGKPFIGPAGRVLDQIISQALGGFLLCPICRAPQYETPSGLVCGNGHGGVEGTPPTYALTNIISCIPLEEDEETANTKKFGEPPDFAIKACNPRLVEFVRLCKPRVIVTVGASASAAVGGQGDFAPINWPHDEYIRFARIVHPSYILRMNVAMRGLTAQKAVVEIIDTIRSLGPSVRLNHLDSVYETHRMDAEDIPDDDVPF
jgi:DNA polymerase